VREASPAATLIEITTGHILPRCLHVVAELGVADALDGTPRGAAELAAAVGADPDALGRMLRLLAAHGVFECRGDAIGHSAMSRLLRSDHPHSVRAFARMIGARHNWAPYGAMEHTLRTGRPAAPEVFPEGVWGYLAQHPQEAEVFNAAMVAKAHGMVAGVLGAYDFGAFATVADVGGGSGHLLRAVLDAVPAAAGVLFDLPHVTAAAAPLASGRLSLQGGDFFRDALPGCDAYLLMEVLHDWPDAEALAILRAVRRAAPPHARLLVIEQLVPDDPGPAWAKVIDVHMLVLLGGRQRTRREYQALLEQARFRLERQIDTGAGVAILEATPV